MSEMKSEVSRMCVRGNLNLMFTISRSIATILDLTETVPLADDVLRSLSENLLCLAADLHGRIMRDYGESSVDTAGKHALSAE